MPPRQGDETRQALAGAPGLKENEPTHFPAATAADASTQAAEQARVQAQDQLIGALRARAAALGWVLHIAAPGGFLAVRWGRVHELADLAAAEKFFAVVGGRRA